jgi:hypothetical protein
LEAGTFGWPQFKLLRGQMELQDEEIMQDADGDDLLTLTVVSLPGVFSVVTWGVGYSCGDSSYVADRLASGVVSITGNAHAFAAVKLGGEVVTWGRCYLWWRLELCG